MTTQFDKIYHGINKEVGKFRVAVSGMAWKAVDAEPVVAMGAKDIKWAQWLRVARLYQLRVGLINHRRETFDGFQREDHEKLSKLLQQHFSITLESKEISVKGWNWGMTDFQVSLEFGGVSNSKGKMAGDEMTEIRFFVPGTRSKLKDEEEQKKAEIGQVAGDTILSFEEVLVLTPRGRYDVDMYIDFLRLRGKTYDYKILYSSISRLFLFRKMTNTRFTREEEITAELNMDEEELAKYDKLKKNYEDPTFEVVSGVFRGLSGKKSLVLVTFPVLTNRLRSRDGHPGIKANLKAIQGDLFMLEKYIFFVSKTPTLVELAEIYQVYFSRVGASMGANAARTFDLRIFTFTSINKEEKDAVETYLRDKKIKVKNEQVPDADVLLAAAGVDDDDDDDASMGSVNSDRDAPKDFQASSSDAGSPTESSDSEGGAATASDASGDRDFKKKKPKKVKAKDGDESPKKKKKKAEKAADSDAEDDGEDKPKKKKKASSPKPKKAKKKADDDAMDIDDDKPKPKPKPKPKAKADGDGVAMDVDDKPRPKPKPKPKPKVKDADADEPPKKKQKKSDD
ncbi:hypothetical protein CPB85DRAFT_1279281 [Mucidula mucida]|nr:hypothetical protein CPB85DRAFT_1279281 [Mucidula mucida]